MRAEKRPDGTTLVTDFDNQYQLEFSQKWLVLTTAGGSLPSLVFDDEFLRQSGFGTDEFVLFLGGLDLSRTRAMAFPSSRDYDKPGFKTRLSVEVIHEASSSSTMSTLVASTLRVLEEYGGQVLTTPRPESPNPNGVEFATVDAVVPARGGVKLRLMFVWFQPGSDFVAITLITPYEYGEELSPALDGLIGSIRLLEK